MSRKQSRYPRTSYGRAGYPRTTPGPAGGLSRRRLLGAGALLGGAGLVELFRGSPHHAAAAVRRTASKAPVRPPRPTSEAAVGPNTGPGPGHADSGHQHAQSSHHHGHAAHHGHGDTPPGHHGDQYGKHGHHESRRGHDSHARAAEHVNLPPPQVRVRHHPIYKLDQLEKHPPHKAIALTIDDGPDPDWTPKVLRLLDKHRMQASFCVVGVHADSYPKLIRDIHKAGHTIVNHSYTHIQPFARQSEKRIVAEITRTQRAIERAAKVTPDLFRSPGGDWSHFVFRAIASYGLLPLDWDVDPEDWARPGRRRIQHRMLHSRPGDIVLCHDGGGDRSETVRALRHVLPEWKHRGYTTVPLIVPPGAKRRPHHTATPAASSAASPSASPSASSTP